MEDFHAWAETLVPNRNKFPSKNACIRTFDEPPARIKLKNYKRQYTKLTPTDTVAVERLIQRTNPGSAEVALQEFMNEHRQRVPAELGMAIVPIGRHHHMLGQISTLQNACSTTICELEFGMLEGEIDGNPRCTRFWEKTKSLTRIQTEMLNWYTSYTVDENMFSLEKLHVSFTLRELDLDPVRATRFKYENGNTYYCNNRCFPLRSKKGCNTSARLWVWDGNAFVNVRGQHNVE